MRSRAGDRRVVAGRDGVVLAEPAAGDQGVLDQAGDGAFQVDVDSRPLPYLPPRGQLVVVDQASGELLGDVGWIPVLHGPSAACQAWNIGIDLLPAARGRGVGTLAQRLLVEHLFATTAVDRIEASTDVANVAEQRALERAGFQREGVLRGAQLRGGQRRDIVLYGVLRTDVSR
ncbi:GNAT family N-acetyltransferase [Goodfellowiella coeruleoviolacea]|uniref:Acetyltransferase (GNAT) domain-containing protein n=1 Tax=Goodfellowiella coeruleoviolacea TaxID=334858 RepID=A0AAE3GED4_9PSEU|nr:GNAT family protein [Goodfellowiella coeruleoviolacea]MCP2165764.1 Acetyltransferase (GNAT) domain-containing protein [Goodfellowiella coeruleoviolacea]